ncbi:MAG: YgdI/YgdR family lipoprotein [Cyclobacteriaceae bacterium]|nr:YgdI/YgdR family lipoprotein [Cyclobacteriaceae bacterium]MDX5465545.1 YgdI/YgdR family lipoprotein [Cyclobacteriaceae bacterium]
MRKLLFLGLILFAGCDELIDIQEIDGPCTIILTDGSNILTNGNIEILKSTGVLTYRDEDGKLWSLTSEEYQSYDCSPN